MSANINVFDPNKPKKVLMVAANASTSKQTGWPVGFWAAELTHPYFEFTDFYEAGKIVAVLCHATCVLLKAKLSDGKFLVEGKTWTGFATRFTI